MTRARDNSFNPSNTHVAGKNIVINGGFDFSQRGTTALASNQYTLDRWYLSSYGTGANSSTAQLRTDAGASGWNNYARISAGSSSVTNFFFSTSFETSEVRKLQGKTVTLSYRYRMPVNFSQSWSVEILYSTGTDVAFVHVGVAGVTSAGSKGLPNQSSWTSDSLTVTIPSNATALGIWFVSTNNTVSNAQFDVAQVQLELGPTPTQFSRAGGTIGGELALCQRYYEKSFPLDVAPANGSNATSFATDLGLEYIYTGGATGDEGQIIPFKVTKRTAPSVSALGNNSGLWLSPNNSFTSTMSIRVSATQRGFPLYQTYSGSHVPFRGHWVASAEL